MDLNSRTFWKVRTTPWLATWWLLRPSMALPSSVTEPLLGW